MRTDLRSLIRLCTPPVRHLHITPLVWLAVLSTTAILACEGDPMSPDGTGRLTITVVPYENAKAEASAAADAEASAVEARPRTATTRAPPELRYSPRTTRAIGILDPSKQRLRPPLRQRRRHHPGVTFSVST